MAVLAAHPRARPIAHPAYRFVSDNTFKQRFVFSRQDSCGCVNRIPHSQFFRAFSLPMEFDDSMKKVLRGEPTLQRVHISICAYAFSFS